MSARGNYLLAPLVGDAIALELHDAHGEHPRRVVVADQVLGDHEVVAVPGEIHVGSADQGQCEVEHCAAPSARAGTGQAERPGTGGYGERIGPGVGRG